MKHSFLRRHYPYRYKGYNLSHCPGNSTPFSKKVVDSKIRCKSTTIFRNINYFFSHNGKKIFISLVFQNVALPKKYFAFKYFALLFC